MLNLIASISLLLSCYFLLRMLKMIRPAEFILAFFCLASAHIVLLGYILSAVNHLGDIRYWAILGCTTAISSILLFTLKWNHNLSTLYSRPPAPTIKIAEFKNWYSKELSIFEKLLLTPLILTVTFLGCINFAAILLSAPHNWDSMTYHLARVAYYLQHNNINYFDANYWAQVVHPKNSSLLLLYTYLVSNRNENLTQLVQFTSYWVAVISVFAISRKVGNNTTQSLFTAMISALLVEWLMQATTTQNDMILTAYLGATIYFLFNFRETGNIKFLWLAALGISLSIGTKSSSFLSLFSAALITVYILFYPKNPLRQKFSNLVIMVSFVCIAVCIFALPSGYIENYHNFGNPIGPSEVRKLHSFEGESISYIVENGSKNLLRYGFDFLSLDGLPIKLARNLQTTIRYFPVTMVQMSGINLETPEATRELFSLDKMPSSHEDYSYWGILGFGLIWVVIVLSLIGVIKPIDIRVLSLATLLFIISQTYSGPYDPWRGRYFTSCAIFAVPTIGITIKAKNKFIRVYLVLIVWLGCISAAGAVLDRDNSPFISLPLLNYDKTSILIMDRMQQLTMNNVTYYEPLKTFDEIVPSNATVAVFAYEDSPEYPLFGKYLTRIIIPINSFDDGVQPIPESADYLLYSQNSFPCTKSSDEYLGADWYLRELSDVNRGCP